MIRVKVDPSKDFGHRSAMIGPGGKEYNVVEVNWPTNKQEKPMQLAFSVYLSGKLIDTVFWRAPRYGGAAATAEDVRRSLVEHDNYSPDIKVRRRTDRQLKRRTAADIRGLKLQGIQLLPLPGRFN